MSDETPLDSTSFNKNYQVLKQTADWLSQQKEPDIDQLVPKVEKAMQAYSICKDRLTKVQETLGQYFDSNETNAPIGFLRSSRYPFGGSVRNVRYLHLFFRCFGSQPLISHSMCFSSSFPSSKSSGFEIPVIAQIAASNSSCVIVLPGGARHSSLLSILPNVLFLFVAGSSSFPFLFPPFMITVSPCHPSLSLNVASPLYFSCTRFIRRRAAAGYVSNRVSPRALLMSFGQEFLRLWNRVTK